MALGATMYVFEVRLNDADRGVYEALTLRVARRPSETAEYLVTRLLAYCLEYTEGIEFSKGLSDVEEPAITVRDLTGALQCWIEVGAPDALRLHKAAKAAPERGFVRASRRGRIAGAPGRRAYPSGRGAGICAVDRETARCFVARLDRRMSFDLAVSDRTLYLTLGDDTLTGTVEERRLVGDGGASGDGNPARPTPGLPLPFPPAAAWIVGFPPFRRARPA